MRPTDAKDADAFAAPEDIAASGLSDRVRIVGERGLAAGDAGGGLERPLAMPDAAGTCLAQRNRVRSLWSPRSLQHMQEK